jgi:galactose mutarotase-like enzyme
MEDSFESHRALRIETIKSPEGGEASFCPERGGIITSLKFHETEVLYLEQDTLEDKKANVRGGIPILFPNAGPLDSVDYPLLKQHGFARTSSAWKAKKAEGGFTETLVASAETLEMYPYDFRFSIDVRFEKDGSFSIQQKVENLEDTEELPLAMGLHPYFKVPHQKKGDIKFDFEGGKFIEEHVDQWAQGKFISIDNPKLKDPSASMRIRIPSLGTLVIDASPEFKKMWIWSQPEKDFVCIEPVMRDVGGLVDDPEKVKPKEALSTSVHFNLEK